MIFLSNELQLIFVVVRPKYSGNIGSVARVIKNFGFNELVFISPRCELDDEAFKWAAHAKDVLLSSKKYNTIQEFIEHENVNYLIGTTARIGGDKNPWRNAVPSDMIRDYMFSSGKIAVLFGSEDTGLTNEELSVCDMVITIPTSSRYPSMNLSHAVAIIAYEFSIRMQKGRKLPYRPSTPEERAVLIKFLEKLVDEVMSDTSVEKRSIYKGILKNLVGRSFLTGREVHSLIGFFRRILGRLKGLRKSKYGD